MRRLFTLTAILLAFLSSSCDNSNEDDTNSETVFFELSQDVYNIGAHGGEIETIVFCNKKWEISGKYDWCRPEFYKGNANEDGVSLKFTIDPTNEERTATFWFRSQDKQIRFTINQSQVNSITNKSDSTYNIPIEGGIIDLVYEANVECKVVIPEDAASWISVIDTRSLKENIISLSIGNNGGSDSRVATVSIESIEDSSLSIEYTILQEGVVFRTAPTLSADKTMIALGESVTFTAMQKDETTGESVDVTKSVTLYDADLNKLSNPFTPTVSGVINVTATKGMYISNTVAITVMTQMPEVPADPQPENFDFNHRILLIDHTGMNCPNCPYMTDNLLALAESPMHKHYNEITCHAGGFASGDPANSPAATALDQFNSGKFSGYPGLCINFYGGKIDNYSSTSYFVNTATQILEPKIKEHADVGIALAVEGDATSIYCAAQVKAKEAKEYKVVAWLLENNIYSPNQAGATKDYHKIYNYALRNISGEYSKSNVSGESVGVIEAGATVDCSFELPIISNNWICDNMGVLVIVSAKDANNRWEVVNSAYCPNNESKAYEYVE